MPGTPANRVWETWSSLRSKSMSTHRRPASSPLRSPVASARPQTFLHKRELSDRVEAIAAMNWPTCSAVQNSVVEGSRLTTGTSTFARGVESIFPQAMATLTTPARNRKQCRTDRWENRSPRRPGLSARRLSHARMSSADRLVSEISEIGSCSMWQLAIVL